jgi:hypothetical protein
MNEEMYMNTPSITRTLAASITLILAFSTIAVPMALAQDRLTDSRGGQSAYSQKSTEALLEDFYDQMASDPERAHTNSELESASNRDSYAVIVFDEILRLPNRQFNNVLLHVMADYRKHPEHRDAIERIAVASRTLRSSDPAADALRESFRGELVHHRVIEFADTMLKDALTAASLMSFFQFGRGFYAGMRSEAEGMLKFKTVYRMVRKSTTSRTALLQIAAAAGAGLHAGMVHAAYDQLADETFEAISEVKWDPGQMLRVVQSDLVREAAVRAAKLRDEMRTLSRLQGTDFEQKAPELRGRLAVIDTQVDEDTTAMSHLSDAAPEYRSRLELVADDLMETRTLTNRLGSRLDLFEGVDVP